MKVFIRESSTAEGCPSAWPNEFDTFLKNSRVQMTSKELKQLNALWSSPHGQHGARVVFSVDGYLPDAWRVSAYHSNHVTQLEGWSTEIESVYGFAMGRSLNGQQNTLSDHEKIFPDLQALMVLELSAFGIGLDQLAVVREDTFSSSWWPSHRRAMAQGLTKAGRLVSHLCPPACPQVQNRVSNP